MKRVLLLSTTTGYQVRMFGEAAERLGMSLVFATDRCHVLDDPWFDRAIAVKFHEEAESVAAIVEAARSTPIDGILAVGDRPTAVAALAADALGLPGHPPDAARASGNKQLMRERLSAAGLPVPDVTTWPVGADARHVASRVRYPCVVKPLALSASRGVIRANSPLECVEAFERVRRLLERTEIRALRDPSNDRIAVEEFIPGAEYALEALLESGCLRPLALFDKPNPLDGPYFEETIYVTPSALPSAQQDAIVDAIARAAEAIGLRHGPIHAECRVPGGGGAPPWKNDRGVFVLEVAARPIGGLCARVLRFERSTSFEELLLRHAVGESVEGYARERCAAGVMMVPIPQEGVYRHVTGVEDAEAVPGVDEISITAKPDQRLEPLPEGGSYLGFIFARGATRDDVVRALERAHARLHFVIDAPIHVRQGGARR
jgi:biotin carboxylase